MEWRIDTSMKGEVAVADLRKTLEASRDHWLKTQAEQAHRAVMSAHVDNLDSKVTADAIQKIAPIADAAKKAHVDKAATMSDAMSMGIDMACDIAEKFGGIVTATIVGHENVRHASGCANRLSVSVDKTWDPAWK